MEQAGESRREFFRLDFDALPGIMQIFEVDMNPVSEEPQEIRIFNLGGGGLYMQAGVDLPMLQEVYATFRFTVQGHAFSFRGHAARKADDSNGFWYGVSFVDVEEADRQALLSALQKEQIDRNRKARAHQV